MTPSRHHGAASAAAPASWFPTRSSPAGRRDSSPERPAHSRRRSASPAGRADALAVSEGVMGRDGLGAAAAAAGRGPGGQKWGGGHAGGPPGDGVTIFLGFSPLTTLAPAQTGVIRA